MRSTARCVASTSTRPPSTASASLFRLAAILAAVLPAAATPSRHFGRYAVETAGAPELGGLYGWSPMPTRAPLGPPADPELHRRYEKGTDTCGFAEGFKSDPWTCYALGASCTVWSGYIGCCATTGVCSSSMISTCYDFEDVEAGSCAGADMHTLCCGSQLRSCWAWTSTTSTEPDVTVTAWNCQSQGGTGALFELPPVLTMSPSDTANTKTTTRNTETIQEGTPLPGSGGGSEDGGDNGNNGTNTDNNRGNGESHVGAIVGGVIGGLALIAFIVLGVALLWRRRKAPAGPGPQQASNAATTQPLMSQQNFHPGGPGGSPGPAPMPMPGQPLPNDQHHSYYAPSAVAGYYDPKQPHQQQGMYLPSTAGYTPPPTYQPMHGGGQPGVSQQWAPGPNQGYLQPQGPHEMPPNPGELAPGSSHNRAELGT